MPLLFKCGCGSYLQVKSALAGKKVRCPKCKEVNLVPDPAERHTRRISRLATKRLDASAFRRLKKAHDEGREVALQEDEVKELGLRSEAPASEERKEKKPREEKKASKPEKAPASKGPKLEPVRCFCGTDHEVDHRPSGERFECSSCGRTVTVPSRATTGLKMDLVPEDDGERCPHCQVELEELAKRCPSCGKKIDLALLKRNAPPSDESDAGRPKKKDVTKKPKRR